MRAGDRVALAALGIVVVLVGLFAWSIEDEYESGLSFTWRVSPGP